MKNREKYVKDYMSPNPITVSPDDHVTVAFTILEDNKIRQAPVVKDGKLIGIVTDRDLRVALTEEDVNLKPITVASIMTIDPETVYEDTNIKEAAKKICERKVNSLPVISKDGQLKGIITTIDIIRAFIND